ncbi:PEP-CTERM sorting domain-containing protein [Rubritalea halochordaticola]|uniref:PEP-CTERM sorting domain-containing protein n=1 Tax=Rubritalea halochordaticola TaxID=714537 RepID=UPI003D15C845
MNWHGPSPLRPSAGGQSRLDNLSVVITSIPQPSSTALLGLGGLALIFRRRK